VLVTAPDGDRRDELDRLRRALYAREVPPGAAERYRDALHAVGTPLPSEVGPPSRPGRRRSALVLVASAAGAAAVVAGLVASSTGPAPRTVPAADVALVAPPAAGTRVWAARGIGSLPSSPVLTAPGTPVVVALACRGRGAVLVLVDQQDRRVVCAAGRVRRDSEYFVGHHGRFTVALSISAPVEWALTVTAVGAG
jgi:hypothetical protein